jgi:hypothetical protein
MESGLPSIQPINRPWFPLQRGDELGRESGNLAGLRFSSSISPGSLSNEARVGEG